MNGVSQQTGSITSLVKMTVAGKTKIRGFGAKTLSIISVIYWSCRPGAQGSTPPPLHLSPSHSLPVYTLDSCVEWATTATRSTIAQLRDLWIKDCQRRAEREFSQSACEFNTIQLSNIKSLVWSLNSCLQTHILHNLQNVTSLTKACPTQKKSETNTITQGFLGWGLFLTVDPVHREAWTGCLPVGHLY